MVVVILENLVYTILNKNNFFNVQQILFPGSNNDKQVFHPHEYPKGYLKMQDMRKSLPGTALSLALQDPSSPWDWPAQYQQHPPKHCSIQKTSPQIPSPGLRSQCSSVENHYPTQATGLRAQLALGVRQDRGGAKETPGGCAVLCGRQSAGSARAATTRSHHGLLPTVPGPLGASQLSRESRHLDFLCEISFFKGLANTFQTITICLQVNMI